MDISAPLFVIPREGGVSSTPSLIDSKLASLEYWIIRFRG
jgi:hypothetical protein